MKRLLLSTLTVCMFPTAAFAENPTTCRSVASVMRDRCWRATAGDNIGNRGCQTEYLMELDRCNRLRLQQVQPVQPVLPNAPVRPGRPPRIGPPPIQPVNPPTVPRINRP